MFSCQTGQVLPGSILYLGLASSLGVTATPAMLDFIEQSELTSIEHAKSALSSSLQINHLLSGIASDGRLVVEGKNVQLTFGYPQAKKEELEKVASFGTQILENNTENQVIIWSMHKSWCFVYYQATDNKPAEISDIQSKNNSLCNPS